MSNFNFQSRKNYLNLVHFSKKYLKTELDKISRHGLTIGSLSLYRILEYDRILSEIKNIKGDIIEFGSYDGNNFFLLKKLLDLKKIKKKIYTVDHSKGLKDFSEIEFAIKKKKLNMYKKPNANKLIKDLIKFFKFDNAYFINKDVMKIRKNFFNKKKFSLVILDLDLYKPTMKILEIIEKHISKNALLVFDQANTAVWKGEKLAVNNFLKKYKNYKILKKIKFYQPDVVIKKLRNFS